MASEITAAQVANITNAEWINPAFQATARDQAVASQFVYEKSLQGRGTDTVSFPRITAAEGSPNLHGAGVDAEFGATEVTDPGNTAMAMTDNTVTAGEYIIVRELGDNAQEDAIPGFSLMQEIIRDGGEILTLAKDDDVVGLFATLTASEGTTATALSFTNMKDAITTLRRAGIRVAGPGGLVYILGTTQAEDFEHEQITSGSSQAQYMLIADRALRVNPDAADGLANRMLGSFSGHPVFDSGLADTANAGVDEVGALFVRGDVVANQKYAAIGGAVSREFRPEPERNARKRTWDIVCTERAGYGLIDTKAGVKLVTQTT